MHSEKGRFLKRNITPSERGILVIFHSWSYTEELQKVDVEMNECLIDGGKGYDDLFVVGSILWNTFW